MRAVERSAVDRSVEDEILQSGYQMVEALDLHSPTLMFRAIRLADRQPVIVQIPSQSNPGLSELSRFHNQYALTKKLDHPGILRFLGLQPCGNRYLLIVEDFQGQLLSELIQRQPLGIETFLPIALQLADTLHHLFQHRIIHKDIKPAHLLIDPARSAVKLIGFAIASVLPREAQEIRHPNRLEGSLSYLSPEQTGRMNRGIDYRSDFYALGVTFYELLTGQLPFCSEDPLELVHSHLTKTPALAHAVNPAVPPQLSQIIAKLMAKNAEDRYQSALGLKHDLEQCAAQWQQTGQIADFPLGQQDQCDRFRIPEKLYGRAVEVQQLLAAFDRVAQGASELLLVSGFSGIGKTAVINEVHKPILRQQGYFIKGKYDQFQRNVPLSAFVQAFRDLVEQLLSETDRQLATWKTRILEALGENAQVIVDVIPELEQIIGPQAAAPALAGRAAQNRFNLLFQKFVQIFTTPAHPLVIFLDDLQWADSASLNLLQLLMQEGGYLLILGAYRDNEVSRSHPLSLTIEAMLQAKVAMTTLSLHPLDAAATNQLIADTLGCQEGMTRSLTDLVMQKTQGNPFFTTQFLKALHQDGWITFDPDQQHWQCDITQIRSLTLTDDIVEFMAIQLQKLPVSTKELLQLAACIGAQFDLQTLSIVAEATVAEVAAQLWPALEEGLILPITETYKFFQGEVASTPTSPQTSSVVYRFLHDRIQQAADGLIAPEQKSLIHYRIGNLLLEKLTPADQEKQLFMIVSQLNCGLALIDQPAERQRLALLNLKAGSKAKESTAYTAATHYFETGIHILTETGWSHDPELMRALHEGAAAAALLNQDFDRMESWIQTVLQQATSLLERLQVYEIKLQAHQLQGQQLQAIAIGRDILQQLGVMIPASATPSEIQQKVAETLSALGDRQIDDLLDLPTMQAADALAALRVITSLVPSAHQVAPELFPCLACEEVNLSLRYGNALLSAPGYADFGIVVSTVLNQPEASYQFGQLSLNLLDRFPSKSVQSMTRFKVAAFIQWHQEPLQQSIQLLQAAYQFGLETGDSVHVSVSVFFKLLYIYLSGTQTLEELAEEIQIYGSTLASTQNLVGWLQIMRQTVDHLTQPKAQPDRLVGEFCDEDQLLPALLQANAELPIHLLFLNKLTLGYLFDRLPEALSHANQGLPYLKGGTGMFSVPMFCYYDALTRLALYPASTPEQQIQLMAQVEIDLEQLQGWATDAPVNFQHKLTLIEAERQRVLGDKAGAIESYDRAIQQSRASGNLQDEALAQELAAKFYLTWGKEAIARSYLQNAYAGYGRWGATAKLRALENRYAALLMPLFASGSVSLPQSSADFAGLGDRDEQAATDLDLYAVLHVAQALMGEIQLDKLLVTLIQILVQTAGADKAALFLNDEGVLRLGIEYFDGAVKSLQPSVIDRCSHVPTAVIHYVERTLETVIGDFKTHPSTVADPYCLNHQPPSLLCMPILNQGKLVGILYLENTIATAAFVDDRVEILKLICSQVAVSLENARLYQQVQQALEILQQKEAQYRGIFETVSDGLAITDLDTGRLIAANSAYCQLHGYRYETILQLDPLDLLQSDKQTKFLDFLTTIQSGQEFEVEARCLQQDGTPIYLEIKSVPFCYEGKPCALSVVRDVTERKQMELAIQDKNHSLEQTLSELQQAQMQIVQSEKMSALGNLVAGVAHEINNPVGFLLGNVHPALDYVNDLFGLLDLYQRQFPQPGAEIAAEIEAIDLAFIREDLPKLIGSMKDGVERIRSVSTSLRTFSRSDSTRPVMFNLHEGLESTLLILKHRLKANHQRPAIEVLKSYQDIPAIACFAGQINQVFMNILANAIDALEEASRERSFQEICDCPNRITITTAVDSEAKLIDIRIQDNGLGMSPALQQKIFDHLFTTKAVGQGTGLGLTIARQIIEENHQGKLSVTSEPGQGTEFVIQLPIKVLA